MTRRYHWANIRDLLTAGFSDEDLRRFCFDQAEFRPVHDALAATSGKSAIVDGLLEYADRKMLVDPLLDWARQQNPDRYSQHSPYVDDTPEAAYSSYIPLLPTPASPRLSPALFAGVPSRPPYLVGRDDLLDDLITRLLNGTGGLALSAEGLPGVGKTTLATALAYHPAILNHFSDGVLWAGLGLRPDVLSLLGQWATALGSDISHLPTEAERAEAVKAAIGQRRLLLVIDDAWQIEPARLLRCGGPYCAHVLTTRDKGLARAFAGHDGVAAIPTLADDPAYTLLESLAPEACAAGPAAARSLAAAVGGLPLALELLGGYLAAPEHGYFPDLSAAALAELGDPARRLHLAQQRLGSHESSATTLQETIALSLAGLPDEARDAFYTLGAFAPKPASFDRPAAEAVSGTGAPTLGPAGRPQPAGD